MKDPKIIAVIDLYDGILQSLMLYPYKGSPESDTERIVNMYLQRGYEISYEDIDTIDDRPTCWLYKEVGVYETEVIIKVFGYNN